MTLPPLPDMELRPFRTALVCRALLAPELDRFLSRRHVDLAVTDQLEALQVRVRAGVDVFHRRIEGAAERARRRLNLLGGALAACLIAAATAGVVARTHGHEFKGSIGAALGLAAALGLGIACVRLGFDLSQLRRLRGRYTGHIEKARTAAELLGFAEQVLEEARRAGAVPALD